MNETQKRMTREQQQRTMARFAQSIESVSELIPGATYRVRGGNWLGSPVLAFEGRYMGVNVFQNTVTFEITEWQQVVFRADVLNTQMQDAEVMVFPIS